MRGEMYLLELGENGLESVVLSPNLEVSSLGLLSCSCRVFKEMMADSAFLRRLSVAHGFSLQDPTAAAASPDRTDASSKDESRSEDEEDGNAAAAEFVLDSRAVDSLEALAVLSSVRELKTNHIVFHLASLKMTSNSEALLDQYATLMKHHPRLRMRIDSHTGVGAPPPIAPQHSVQRACRVARHVMRHGISLERILACAWGMDVGRKQRWAATQEYARAEVYLSMAPREAVTADSKEEDQYNDEGIESGQVRNCMPCWPSYYEEIRPRVACIAKRELAGEGEHEHDDHDEAGSGDDDAPGGFTQIIALMQTLGPHGVVVWGGEHISVADVFGHVLTTANAGQSDDSSGDDAGGSDDQLSSGVGSDEDDSDEEEGEARGDGEEEEGNQEDAGASG
jgi:outer membrane protein OmpA-like peptidoglycan-associated protein